MTTPFRIGVLGTHSTGKTTLLQRIEMELRGNGLQVCRTGRLAKRAALIGLPKMQHHTTASTEWIISQSIADEIELSAGKIGAEVVLADRAVHDALAYYTAALEFCGEQPDTPEVERLRLLTSTQSPKYDLLIATVLDPKVPVAKKHDYDARYRALVNDHVHRLLAEEKLEHVLLTSDPDSQAEAIRIAVEAATNALTR